MFGSRCLPDARHGKCHQLAVLALGLMVLPAAPALARDCLCEPNGQRQQQWHLAGTPWRSVDKVNADSVRRGRRHLLSGRSDLHRRLEVFFRGRHGSQSDHRISSYGTGRATFSVPATVDGFVAYNFARLLDFQPEFPGCGATLTSKQGVNFYADLAAM